jgi:hypothetical protein
LLKATIDGVVRAPFGVFNDAGLLAVHNGDAGVGGSEGPFDTSFVSENSAARHGTAGFPKVYVPFFAA